MIHAFFGTETQKLTKLVEGGRARRRSRWCRSSPGRWTCGAGSPTPGRAAPSRRPWSSRSTTRRAGSRSIRLGDDNLAYVANQRLLAPAGTPTRPREIDEAFRRLDRRAASWDVLLDGVNTDDQHRGADEAQFRLTYPFSPGAGVDAAVAGRVMQRERTALKVMQQMLVDRRDTLTIDDVIPVGDAFDYLVTGQRGDQPLDEASAALFRSAEHAVPGAAAAADPEGVSG